jgi:hypothetical protein
MKVLIAFGYDAIQRPHEQISAQHASHRMVSPARVGERDYELVKRSIIGASYFYDANSPELFAHIHFKKMHTFA